jgi:phosphohistidine phosphatase
MTMDLILWRHAEASETAAGGDLERPLTAKGERQAQRVGQWLNRHLSAGAKVLVSPALRAQQTALALERKVRTVAEIAPGASVEAVLAAARWPRARNPVLVVGHQPTLGLVVAWLLAEQAEPWPIRKAGVWWLRARERGGKLQVVLQAAITPEML